MSLWDKGEKSLNEMIMLFKKNDIVRLKEEYFDRIKSKLFFPQNIFFINKYFENGNFVLLRNIEEQIPSEEICPVRMDGVEDRNIYYDPNIAADFVRPGEPLKSHHVDKDEYYLHQLKNSFDPNDKSYYDIVMEGHYNYVHELQHSRPDIGRDLKINYKVLSYIKPLPSKMKLEAIATMMTYKSYIETKDDWEEYVKVYIEKEIRPSKMIATSVPTNKVAYVLLFNADNRFDARYAEFYINSSIGKLFLLSKHTASKLEGNVTLANLRKLVLRWVDIFKECCVYLESLLQVVYVYESHVGKEHPSLTGLLSFLCQVRDAMVMEMMMPELFEKANFSILKKWKHDTDAIMLEFYQAEEASDKQIKLIGKLIDAIGSTNEGIVNEMAKYRIYMLEFMRFAEQKKSEL